MPHTINTLPTFSHPGGPRVERGVPEGGEWMDLEIAMQANFLAFSRMVYSAQAVNRTAARRILGAELHAGEETPLGVGQDNFSRRLNQEKTGRDLGLW